MPCLTPAEGEAPPFRAIGIVGLGLIGGSLALAARRAWPQIHVVGVDRGPALEAARLLPAFDAVGDHLRVLAGVDLVVLAAPVRQNVALVAELAATLAGPSLVSDAGSTKRAMVNAARVLPPHLPFIGGHPLAGAARGGSISPGPTCLPGAPGCSRLAGATRRTSIGCRRSCTRWGPCRT